ncbi:Ribosomal protein S12 methylthiotransferase RimO [Galdieria sulphuraria]|uniref:Uncharacterized protein n=1 Tax=Galdieria sulphuraria TaxID=130081 RepID=M2XFU7_GALSU|nr:uncharacterized protein Gasu_36360 [Galdieria sulphuraria]EME28897.1 hypothetical protein Gasu_36360 [Galdieria sulphuraria]GJD08286.1 Ribosomal protein S12 methylthiotransferase RimO [Galdieria sulphuraria]|eukprot:XP_005705417.1 hypothetical protein Gasu_36360 [Galdieria sulphuraria]
MQLFLSCLVPPPVKNKAHDSTCRKQLSKLRPCPNKYHLVMNHVQGGTHKRKVALVSLGCPKNTVDAEVLLGNLKRKGFQIVEKMEKADAVIINTCGFIEDAKRESLSFIFQALDWKKKHLKGVIVTGCLAQRYAEELAAQIPQVDAVVGFESYANVAQTLNQIFSQQEASRVQVGKATVPFQTEYIRHPLTPKHSAYLRVAEGCNHECSFCSIPSFRGRFRSKPFQSVIEEAKMLVEGGVCELNIIAEDTNQYGMDFGNQDQRRLADLLYELANLSSLKWIRLLYCYPSYFSPALIRAIAEIPQVVKYIDIPLQHASDGILTRMNRPNSQYTRQLLYQLKQNIPELCLRSTFICGFPGETEKDHQELVRFIKELGFSRAGFFTYSLEENTSAYSMDGHVPDEVKQARKDELVSLQQSIQESFAMKWVGKKINVLIDKVEQGYSKGRAYFDAPEIDGVVYVLQQLSPGRIYSIEILGTNGWDLYGHK